MGTHKRKEKKNTNICFSAPAIEIYSFVNGGIRIELTHKHAAFMNETGAIQQSRCFLPGVPACRGTDGATYDDAKGPAVVTVCVNLTDSRDLYYV
jgi:hypothetical protein